MSRTSSFRQLAHSIRAALYCEAHDLPTREGMERLEQARRLGRRSFLGTAAAAGAVAAIPGCAMDVASSRRRSERERRRRRRARASRASPARASSVATGLSRRCRPFPDRSGAASRSATRRCALGKQFGLDGELSPRRRRSLPHGRIVDEAEVVDESARSCRRCRTISADAAERRLHRVGSGPRLRARRVPRGARRGHDQKALDAAYTIEYGLDIERRAA
jgi:hypothetical protein